MRGKRAKQYRKLMQQYGLTFGFREPYQVLVDAQMIQDTERFKMDLVGGLERTLSGKVKPMITQCSIRHLYSLPPTSPPRLKEGLIALAKSMERRRCNHHELDEPLSTLECISSVVDPKGSGTNKNRYVVASQEEEVRRSCRGVKGVPLVYVKRSVMVMEPMSEGSVDVREASEKEKFRLGLRGRVAGLGKRKREGEERVEGGPEGVGGGPTATDGEELPAMVQKKKPRTKGPKGPNPLSVKKAKPVKDVMAKGESEGQRASVLEAQAEAAAGTGTVAGTVNGGEADASDPLKRKKKRRRQKPTKDVTAGTAQDGEGGQGGESA